MSVNITRKTTSSVLTKREKLLEKITKWTNKSKTSGALQMTESEKVTLKNWQNEIKLKLENKGRTDVPGVAKEPNISYDMLLQMHQSWIDGSKQYADQLSFNDLILMYEHIDDFKNRVESIINWDHNNQFYTFIEYGTIKKIKDYLDKNKTKKQRTFTSSSLIPIKGVSRAMQTKLKQ